MSQDNKISLTHIDKYIKSKFDSLKSQIIGEIGQKTDILIQQIENLQEKVRQLQGTFEKYLGNMKEVYSKAHSFSTKRRKFKASYKLIDMQEFQDRIQDINQQQIDNLKTQENSNMFYSYQSNNGKTRKRGKISKTMRGIIDIVRGVRTQQQVARQLKISIDKIDRMISSYARIQQTQ